MKSIVYSLPLLAVFYSSNTFAAAGDADFDQGMAAFKKGDYESALQAFRAAGQKGLRSVELNYNLGVVNYKLGNLERAKLYFTRLRKFPRLSQLASYNLGLIAER